MSENNEFVTEVVDTTDEPETETEETFNPWKPLIAAVVVGATSAAVVAKIKSNRRKKAAEAEAEPTDESTPESNPVPNS